MRVLSLVCALATTSSAVSLPRGGDKDNKGRPNLVPANYDGQCFYPTPDPSFKLEKYLGKWYQVAGTPFRETAGARCITADYSLNPNGTVRVQNGGKISDTRSIGVVGTATPVNKAYGKGGAFIVEFPSGYPSACPGPNYIVQEYGGEYAVVQTADWGVLYILSREQKPKERKVERWIERAVELGSNATAIVRFSQEDC